VVNSRVIKVAPDDVAPNRKRGGDLRALLTPSTVGSTAGFMGVATLEPGEFIAEHYHPYSEEFLYLVRGRLCVKLDGEPVDLKAGEGMLIRRNVRHRLQNDYADQAFVVFSLSPLAPRPELGHVDTETPPGAAPAAPIAPAAAGAPDPAAVTPAGEGR
jgi:putative monooxygenase